MNWTRKIYKFLLCLTAAVFAVSAASCGDMFNENLDECQIDYRLKFRFDMNLLFADAFHTQVNSVTVYAYDKDGKLVWKKSEKGAPLTQEGYTMDINDLPRVSSTLWLGAVLRMTVSVMSLSLFRSRPSALRSVMRYTAAWNENIMKTALHIATKTFICSSMALPMSPSMMPGLSPKTVTSPTFSLS